MNLEYLTRQFKKLIDILSKDNKNSEQILFFLTKLFFFMFLGSSEIIKNYSEIINELRQISTEQELRDSFSQIFRNLSGNNVESNKYNLPEIGEPFSLKSKLPKFNQELVDYLKNSTFYEFNWKELKALDFCDIFESLINSEEKHSKGMYFTSIENIYKVINPLFLDQLRDELEHILQLNVGVSQRLLKFLIKISHLNFLDPSCGSGHFLVETYNALKLIEDEILNLLENIQINIYKNSVTIDQFYGIEVSESSAAIAKTALWIARYQKSSKANLKQFVPYKNENIKVANALRTDWNDLIPKNHLNYILGNPPFLGARLMTSEQKEDLKVVFGNHWHRLGDLDYVSGWFKKSYDYMKGTDIETAFVSTSSVTEGMSPANLFKPLIKDGMRIDFAYDSFKWHSQINNSATVYVVIIGFRAHSDLKNHYLYSGENKVKAKHINGYLFDGPEIYAESRTQPISAVPRMGIGNKPVDGGNYLFKKQEYLDFIEKEPGSKRFFRPFYGAMDLIKQSPRYCLWLGDSSENEYKNLPLVMDRVKNVIKFRKASRSPGTRKLAQLPTHFHVENNPDSMYLAVPRVSSQNREYIPFCFFTPDIMTGDSLLIIPNCDYYHFGILSSHLHMVWMNFVCGRFGQSYRYSKEIVYNNFPWPDLTEVNKEKIEETAKEIIKYRKKYSHYTLKELYNPKTMPKDLKEVHLKNDQAVLEAYCFDKKDIKNDKDLVLLLFNRYRKILESQTNQLNFLGG